MIKSINSKMFKRFVTGLPGPAPGPLRYPKPSFESLQMCGKEPKWTEDCKESRIDSKIRKHLEEKFKKDNIKIHKRDEKEKTDKNETTYNPKYGSSLFEPKLKNSEKNNNSFREFHDYNKMSVKENQLFMNNNNFFWIP
mgnify:CR=1 FL=1